MCIFSFCSTGRRKIHEFQSYKIVITQNDRNHSDFHLGMAVLGFELRLPCYQVIVFHWNLMPLWTRGKEGSRLLLTEAHARVYCVMTMDFEYERKLLQCVRITSLTRANLPCNGVRIHRLIPLMCGSKFFVARVHLAESGIREVGKVQSISHPPYQGPD
jgi:hypothetical protein